MYEVIKRQKPAKNLIAFKAIANRYFKRGKSYETAKGIDSNIDNYVFLEITESGKTAIYYNKLLKDKEKLHATKTYDKISELAEDIQELIYSKFNML